MGLRLRRQEYGYAVLVPSNGGTIGSTHPPPTRFVSLFINFCVRLSPKARVYGHLWDADGPSITFLEKYLPWNPVLSLMYNYHPLASGAPV